MGLLLVAGLYSMPAAQVSAPEPTTPATQPEPGQTQAEPEQSSLAEELQAAIVSQNFTEVLDTEAPLEAEVPDPGPSSTAADPAESAYEPIQAMPNIDATVIELDDEGAPVAAANVLTSPAYPDGLVLPIDQNFSTAPP